MAGDILINCSILGPEVERSFPVVISPSRTVGQLKETIKGTMAPKLDHVAASDLDIWKASDPMKSTHSHY